jgi:Domain of unknown function (DUF4430)
MIVSVAASAALLAPATAAGIEVHVRVEGAAVTLFGAGQPLVTPFVGTLETGAETTLELMRPTPLGALEAASRRSELFYRMDTASFGTYVVQIGRLAGEGASGWVYKVNGVSPPVGADAFTLEQGDEVLWYYATFGDTGGPLTLDLRRVEGRCFRAFEVDDTGAAGPTEDVTFRLDGRSFADADGRFCPTGHWHRLRATKEGLVRSEVLAPR